jgi:hypothetical protein
MSRECPNPRKEGGRGSIDSARTAVSSFPPLNTITSNIVLDECTVCEGKDHLAVCPQGKTRKDNVVCFKCKKLGHFGFDCPDKAKMKGNETDTEKSENKTGKRKSKGVKENNKKEEE